MLLYATVVSVSVIVVLSSEQNMPYHHLQAPQLQLLIGIFDGNFFLCIFSEDSHNLQCRGRKHVYTIPT